MKSFLKNCLFITCLVTVVNSYAQNVGVGSTTPLGKLHIKGSANNSQLIIDANNTQSNTSPLFKLRTSLGTDLLWIHSDTAFNTFMGLNAGRINNAIGGGVYNTFIGRDVGYSNTTGSSNTAIGAYALASNTTGNNNSAIGINTLFSNTTGSNNSAQGIFALYSNTTGIMNSAHGYAALHSNTTGKFNSAHGARTLYSNISGNANSAHGIDALWSNTSGAGNTANGNASLYYNTNGYLNSAHGYLSLFLNTTGYENTANGSYSMGSNSTGTHNTALGFEALFSNTTGSNNTALGYKANVGSGELNNATAIGANASVSTSNSIVLGSIQGVNGATASTNVGIGTSAPNPKAILEIKSTSQGVLFPMLTTAQRDAIVSPPHGLHIFNTDEGCLNHYNSTYQYWTCYCDDCQTKVIHISANDCSVDFYNDYAIDNHPASKYIIVVDSGVVISTCSFITVGAISFSTMPFSGTIKIINYGTIAGLGGWGGNGNYITESTYCGDASPTNGLGGLPAVWTKNGVIIQIENHGVIAGGGGGGGGGNKNPSGYGGGGGGGAGINGGDGGQGGGTVYSFWCTINEIASRGMNGTETGGGLGGAGASGGGTGGNGGARGQPGQSGVGQNAGLGGPAGKAISGGIGNSITNVGSGQSFGVVD